jgi:hypothetical protein
MNYLGRNRLSCAAGLHEYHPAGRRMRQCATQPCSPACALERLDRLRFDVEVDVQARSGPRASERMTEVELTAFYPALRKLHRTLSGIAGPGDPATWVPQLDAAQRLLRDAVHRLRRE